MTREQLAKVLACVPGEWRLFFDLLATTGVRASEALGLDRSDVEFGAARPRPVLSRRPGTEAQDARRPP